jgi:NodT family efflux transporter outer membrane factor (OMF) lipoprotein
MPDVTPPNSADPAQHLALGQQISGDWWQLFHSRPLDEVVQGAIAQSPTLDAARATVAQADEAVIEARGNLYPRVEFSASAGRQKPSKTLRSQSQRSISNTYSVGPTVSYGPDIFGATGRLIENQEALAQFQRYQLDAAYLTLTSNAAIQAVTIASIRAQIKAVEDIIADDQQNLSLAQTRLEGGVSTELDVLTAESQLTSDQTELPTLNQELSVARHALAILEGKAPVEWSPPDFDLSDFTLPEELPVSLPSALVRQRPDILAAEAQLHAASAEIGIATAELYPNITLSASLGQSSATTGKLLSSLSNVWSIAADLTAPIFNGGALEAQKRAAVDAFQTQFANYRQTVLESFGQVADVLDAISHDSQLLANQHRALDAAQRALEVTRTNYTEGVASFLNVLDAERTYQQARLNYVRGQSQRYLDTIQLFAAMGGGWWNWPDGSPAGMEDAAAPAQTPSANP